MKYLYLLLFVFFAKFQVFSQDESQDDLYELEENEEIKEAIKQAKVEIKGWEKYIRVMQSKLPVPEVKKSKWKYTGNASINFTENIQGDWAAGGLSNYGLSAIAHVEQDFRSGKDEWDNTFDGRFGFIKTFDAVSGNSRPLFKSMDMLQLSTKYLRHLKNDKFSIGFEATFISQFTKTYDLNTGTYLISDFLAPGILDLSPGFEYDPFQGLRVFVAPFNYRLKFVSNNEISDRTSPLANRYGHAVGEEVTYEIGSKIDALYEKQILSWLFLRSRLQLLNSWGRPNTMLARIYSSRTNVDVNFQTDLFIRLFKKLSLQVGLMTIYDDDNRFVNVDNPDPDGKKAVWQIRNNLGVGIFLGF